jgi:hypothetical protein
MSHRGTRAYGGFSITKGGGADAEEAKDTMQISRLSRTGERHILREAPALDKPRIQYAAQRQRSKPLLQ